MRPDQRLDVDIRGVAHTAQQVLTLSLGRRTGGELPEWQPGAHIDVHLPSGNIRQYSLHGDPHDRLTYQISVLRVVDGRGGSAELHDLAQLGARLQISLPRNTFALHPADHYLFVAGGIGITALLPMIRSVARTASWRLVYVGRRRATMAFVDDVVTLGGAAVDVFAVDERRRPDLAAIVHTAPPNTTVYCCGPARMLDAVNTAHTQLRSDITVRSELFTPPRADASPTDTAFDLVLARSGVTLTVPTGVSMLDAVRALNPDVMSSCERGICSACETAVLEGIPDHRDSVLTPAEHATNRYVMLCVSRAKTGQLVLDL